MSADRRDQPEGRRPRGMVRSFLGAAAAALLTPLAVPMPVPPRPVVKVERKPARGGKGRAGRLVVKGLRPALAALVLAAPGAALAHDIYQGWMRPDQPDLECCGESDCRRTQLCEVAATGQEGVMIAGVCMAIPYAKVLSFPSPDGYPHACYGLVPFMPVEVYCVSLPARA